MPHRHVVAADAEKVAANPKISWNFSATVFAQTGKRWSSTEGDVRFDQESGLVVEDPGEEVVEDRAALEAHRAGASAFDGGQGRRIRVRQFDRAVPHGLGAAGNAGGNGRVAAGEQLSTMVMAKVSTNSGRSSGSRA
ncbi:hypothetical protein L0U85_07885 [Glycomyces sp. L485]|uniref:hypothetical protein n=1 Tax=Glycomyces sp. L485 TaxID=2909235 RepID=UPI001F4A39E2|nr:hypothetical protein [Glycomyces sp. L485]MCH7230770.1 hypothetical protein [Glycomyces sp. L485]